MYTKKLCCISIQVSNVAGLVSWQRSVKNDITFACYGKEECRLCFYQFKDGKLTTKQANFGVSTRTCFRSTLIAET